MLYALSLVPCALCLSPLTLAWPDHGFFHRQRLEFFPLRPIYEHGHGRNTIKDKNCSQITPEHEKYKPIDPNAFGKCERDKHGCHIFASSRRLIRR